jgi:hypothetical protein
MAINSIRWLSAGIPRRDGQSMFATLATHTPRNSRCTAGGIAAACAAATGVAGGAVAGIGAEPVVAGAQAPSASPSASTARTGRAVEFRVGWVTVGK